jgi:hypothetical protein
MPAYNIFKAPNAINRMPQEMAKPVSTARARSMAIKPISMTTPESIALIPLGACECASGSQVWRGTRATLTPKPIRNKAPAPNRAKRFTLGPETAAAMAVISNVPVCASIIAIPINTSTEPVALWTRYFIPASSEAACSR